MPFSRKHESEADQIGLHYMARAGFDPRESLRFWQRMEEARRAQPPEFLSTHPSHGHRLQLLETEMPRALEEFNGSTQKQTSLDQSRAGLAISIEQQNFWIAIASIIR